MGGLFDSAWSLYGMVHWAVILVCTKDLWNLGFALDFWSWLPLHWEQSLKEYFTSLLQDEKGRNHQCLQALQLQLQTITDNIKVLNSNHQVLHDRWETSISQFKASWAQICMIYQLHLKPLIITFYWTVQSPWQDWKNWCIMQPLLSRRNTKKMVLCQCLCVPNVVFCVVFCVVVKDPSASQAIISDVEKIVST